MIALRLERPMSSPSAPTWSGAVWVGTVDVNDLNDLTGDAIALGDSTGYGRARLLIRRARAVLGFVELPIAPLGALGGTVSVDDLRTAVGKLPRVPAAIEPLHLPTVTVIICTRDRPEQLRGALTSVLALDYPAFDVVVVDNAGATDETAELVRTEFADPRVRLVREPLAGLSRARNTGLLAAAGEIVAYTDDDVVVDRDWLRGLVSGFARGEDVSCVTGLVPSGELRTPVQRFFDDRVSWSRNLVSREFRLADPPLDLAMFPFSVGEFGTGANFALRRSSAISLGGFDTAFGVGTRTGGGEDLDVFTRVLFAGDALVVEPSALVWHRHRSDLGALRAQAVGYGVGLGAWLTKVALTPAMLRVAVRRAPDAARRLVAKGGGTLESGDVPAQPATGLDGGTDWARAVSKVGWIELLSVAKGPLRYLRQRWDGTGLIDPGARAAALARRA
ncbi:Putative mycofactocin biosynthesis glycosyltransferase MftF [Frondihabitans sp. 762G35]|uniref:glycosyltransferase family 2 protein n=1 Tax=Frondihabitans sp. 762G35 TaxID=1446794 RepID=UPI000D22068B|nr:glycosyltransferase [Frondihabitans sp. 762G35]ARC55648.1 Putative mycofactocin biosynthesis glycosyltransferase MftF [Frondihabitans sp. 762G35]